MKKILIVEDDEHVARIYAMKLAKDGHTVSVVANGEDAMDAMEKETPDLVVLDLMLPKKDGFAVLEEMKKHSELSNVPVLVISNLGQRSDQERALALGAKEYLVKVEYPVEEVIARAEKYLK